MTYSPPLSVYKTAIHFPPIINHSHHSSIQSQEPSKQPYKQTNNQPHQPTNNVDPLSHFVNAPRQPSRICRHRPHSTSHLHASLPHIKPGRSPLRPVLFYNHGHLWWQHNIKSHPDLGPNLSSGPEAVRRMVRPCPRCQRRRVPQVGVQTCARVHVPEV